VGRWFGAHTDTGLQEHHLALGAVGMVTNKLEGHGQTLAQIASGAKGTSRPSNTLAPNTQDQADRGTRGDAASNVANTQANQAPAATGKEG
jgi:hypothetical protein